MKCANKQCETYYREKYGCISKLEKECPNFIEADVVSDRSQVDGSVSQKTIDGMSRTEVENYAQILGRMCENSGVHILQAKDRMKRKALEAIYK